MQGEARHVLLFRRQTGKFNILNIHKLFPLVLIAEVEWKHFVLGDDALLGVCSGGKNSALGLNRY
jgi:hypothetical protein